MAGVKVGNSLKSSRAGIDGSGKPHIRYAAPGYGWRCALDQRAPLGTVAGYGETPAQAYANWMRQMLPFAIGATFLPHLPLAGIFACK